MNISFIILTWNSERHIKNCLKSILCTVSQQEYLYEIFVVDNGSTDNTREILASMVNAHNGIIKPIFFNHNIGTTFSRNQALKVASGQYLCILDSDVIVHPNSIQQLINALKSSPEIGLIAPRLLYADGRLQKSTDDFPTILTKIIRFFFLKQQEAKEAKNPSQKKASYVDYAIAAFWVFPRKILEDVGLLDENIFYAPEDVDFCLRIWEAGYCIKYDPVVSSTHDAQEISRGFKVNKALLEHTKGLFYFFKKHRYFIKKPCFKLFP